MLIHIKDLSVRSANAHSGFIVAGYPAPTAFSGFIDDVLRTFSTPRDFNFMVMHKHFSMRASSPYEHKAIYRNNWPDSDKKLNTRSPNASSQPAMMCDLKFDLFIDVEISTEDNHPSVWDINVLRTMRCLGGRASEIGGLSVLDANELASVITQTDGYFFTHRHDLKPTAGEDALDWWVSHFQRPYSHEPALDELGNILDPFSVKGDERAAIKAKQKTTLGDGNVAGEPGWLVPAHIGYRALEDAPVLRKGTRKPDPHIFVDPIFAVCEFIHTGRYFGDKFIFSELPFWTRNTIENTYFLTISKHFKFEEL